MISSKVYFGYLVIVFLNYKSAVSQNFGNSQNFSNSLRSVLDRIDLAANSLEQRGQESGFVKDNVVSLFDLN